MVRKNERMFEIMNITPLGISVLSFMSRSGREHFIREIAREVGSSAGGTHEVLGSLFDLGLVERRTSGRNVYFRAVNEHPAIRHFKIFTSIMELRTITSSLERLSSRIILFGSCATGEDTLGSDMDLMVVTGHPSNVRKTIQASETSRRINAVVLRPQELAVLKRRDRAFYDEAMKGIILGGRGDDDTREVS